MRGTKLFPSKQRIDLSLTLHFGTTSKFASSSIVGNISINSTGVDIDLGSTPGTLNIKGTFKATSKLLYFAHRPFSPNDQPKT